MGLEIDPFVFLSGGGCRFCGSVEHLKSDCPRKAEKDSRSEVKVGTINGGRDIEDVADEEEPQKKRIKKDNSSRTKSKKVVKF